MDSDPNRTALREARRKQKLGDIPSVCAFCPYEGPVILVTKKWLRTHGVSKKWLKKWLEDHHPGGRNHDPGLKIPICRNCHGECTEGLLRAGVRMCPTRNKRERLALTLEAQAAFFEDFARAQRRNAEFVRAGLK
jgi:hypothetical protein